MSSIAYGTPVTALSFKECDDLQKPVVNAILPKMGITSKASASGRFRPVEMREINRCGLYLQVFYTSDIVDNSGKNLEP
jgi:hypothetical protein